MAIKKDGKNSKALLWPRFLQSRHSAAALRALLCICASFLFLATPASGADKLSRPCQKEDIIGTWEMVSVKPVRDKTDPVFFSYQRFVFNKDSSMKFMTSEKPLTKEWLDKFQKQPAEIDYSLNEKGILTLTWHSRPYSELALCAYVLSDVPTDVLAKIPPADRGHMPKKGNIALSYFDSAGRIAYQKILTRILQY